MFNFMYNCASQVTIEEVLEPDSKTAVGKRYFGMGREPYLYGEEKNADSIQTFSLLVGTQNKTDFFQCLRARFLLCIFC